eukprot:6781595-Heterocapsa_arctica.AAC.1
MGPEGAAQGVPDRPAETTLEETKFVELVNIVERNMKKETDSLDNFGTYVWVPEKMAEQKGAIMDKSKWILGECDAGKRVKTR